MPEKRTSFSCKLTDEQSEKLYLLLRDSGRKLLQMPYTRIAVEWENCKVNLYNSGKLLVQGSGTENFIIFTLEPEILGVATLGYEEVVNSESVAPHMGIDESGKGDFFGPLVACAAYTDPQIANKMREIGTRDCKELSDSRILVIGAKLRNFLGPNRFKIVAIGPLAYNRLYAKNRNVNSILSWAHARAIENLLTTMPSCPRAVADQFGDERLIRQALMKKGQGLTLEQRHKAESDIAVAAASVLAREYFLQSLKKLSDRVGVVLPKGASEAVVKAGIEAVAKNGPPSLLEIAKCHFRTTDSVLSASGKSRTEIGPLGEVVSRAKSVKS